MGCGSLWAESPSQGSDLLTWRRSWVGHWSCQPASWFSWGAKKITNYVQQPQQGGRGAAGPTLNVWLPPATNEFLPLVGS